MTLRGVKLITGMTIMAEPGDITRFDSPRQLLMSGFRVSPERTFQQSESSAGRYHQHQDREWSCQVNVDRTCAGPV